MKRALVLVTVAFLVQGCASTPPKYFKTNVTQQEFQRDVWECQQIVNQSYQPPQQSNASGGAGAAIGYMLGRSMSEKGRHKDCMYGRGYQAQ
jgi:hypothetical protein